MLAEINPWPLLGVLLLSPLVWPPEYDPGALEDLAGRKGLVSLGSAVWVLSIA